MGIIGLFTPTNLVAMQRGPDVTSRRFREYKKAGNYLLRIFVMSQ